MSDSFSYCTRCGSQIKRESNFCNRCGAPVCTSASSESTDENIQLISEVESQNNEVSQDEVEGEGRLEELKRFSRRQRTELKKLSQRAQNKARDLSQRVQPKIDTFSQKVQPRIEQTAESLRLRLDRALQTLDRPGLLIKGRPLSESTLEIIERAALRIRESLSREEEPSPEVIDEAEEWIEKLANRLEEDRCLICLRFLESGENVVICPHCLHGGHQNHLEPWVTDKGICPLCREPLQSADFLSIMVGSS